MIYIPDTHALIWHLENNPRLSVQASAIFSSPQSEIVILSIVLAEIWHLYERRRIRASPTDVRDQLLSSANCSVHPLDETVVQWLPTGFEIHDAIIVATALVFRDVMNRPAQVITRDQAIARSQLVDVLW